MSLTRRALIGTATVAVALPCRRARSAAKPDLRVGLMNATFLGPVPAICVRQAIQEFTAGKDMTVEVLVADHKNKPEVAANIARQWIDQEGVDVIADAPLTPPALAVNEICREKNKVLLLSAVGTTDLTGKHCAPTTVHWTFDTYMLAKSPSGPIVKAGGDTWFYIYPDYQFGRQLKSDASRFVTEAGGKVLGSAGHPLLGNGDFPTLVRQAGESRSEGAGNLQLRR